MILAIGRRLNNPVQDKLERQANPLQGKGVRTVWGQSSPQGTLWQADPQKRGGGDVAPAAPGVRGGGLVGASEAARGGTSPRHLPSPP